MASMGKKLNQDCGGCCDSDQEEEAGAFHDAKESASVLAVKCAVLGWGQIKE